MLLSRWRSTAAIMADDLDALQPIPAAVNVQHMLTARQLSSRPTESECALYAASQHSMLSSTQLRAGLACPCGASMAAVSELLKTQA